MGASAEALVGWFGTGGGGLDLVPGAGIGEHEPGRLGDTRGAQLAANGVDDRFDLPEVRR